MKSTSVSNVCLFCVLVVLGVTARLVQRDLPNFMPVAAISLFAGYYFTHLRWAALVAPAIMLISDCCIGFYRPELMVSVYTMLTIPVLARQPLKQMFKFEGSVPTAWLSFASLIACSLFASICFFVVTNFVCWAVGGNMYEYNLAGLTRCYVQAIPFFRNTLLGDLFFSFTLFGAYALVLRAGWLHQPELQPVTVRVK